MNKGVSGHPPIFYGWYIVAAGFVCMWVNAGMGFYAFPVFFVHLDKYFGWGMMKINLGLSISMLFGGLTSPLVGQFVPQLGAKKIIVAGALIMSASFVFFGLMQTLWQYYLVCLVLAIGWTCAGSIATTHSIADWFEKKRGIATGIMMVGVGLGGFSISPLTRWLADMFEWRPTFFIYAVATSVILVPVAALIFKRRPAELGVLPDGEVLADGENLDTDVPKGWAQPRVDWTFRDAVSTSAFWIISLIYVLVTFGQTALLLNQVKHFESIGISSKSAASALGSCAMLGILGKLFFGWMADRYTARNAMFVSFGLQAVGTVLLIFSGTLGSPWYFVIVWGFAMGGVIVLQPLIVAECFGMKSFGVILGMTFVATTVGSAAGPPFAGLIFDMSGSYVLAFVVFIVTYAIGAFMSFLAIPPKPPQAV